MMPLMLLVLTLEHCGSCSTASVSANRPMPHGPGLQRALQKARWSTRREGRPGDEEEEAGQSTATLALHSITVPAGCSSQLCQGRCPGVDGRAGQQQWHAYDSRLPSGVAAVAGLNAGRACGRFDGRAALRLRGGGRAFRERTTEKARKRHAMLKAAAKVCAYAIRTRSLSVRRGARRCRDTRVAHAQLRRAGGKPPTSPSEGWGRHNGAGRRGPRCGVGAHVLMR